MAIAIEHFQSTLGAAGLKVSVSNVLDLGDPKYPSIPEEIKAAVWVAAMNHGWTRDGVKTVIKFLLGKRYDDDTAELTVSNLELAAKNFPVDNSVAPK